MGNLISTTPSITDTIMRRMTRDEEIAIRNTKDVINSIEKVRSYPDTECPEAKAAKGQNYYSCPQAQIPGDQSWTYRKNVNFIPSGKVILDYDKHGDWQTFMDKIKDRFEELNFLHIERSCRDGIHAIVPRIEGLTINETINWYERALDLELDHKTKDVARACFLVPQSFVLYDTDDYYKDFVDPQIQEIPDDLERDYMPPAQDITSTPTPLTEEEEWEQLEELCRQHEKAKWDIDDEVTITTTTTQSLPKVVEDEYHRMYESDYEELDHIIQTYIVPRRVDCTVSEPEWFALACVIASIQGEDGREMFHAVSSFHPHYDPRETNRKYDHVLRSGYSGYTLGTLIFQARRYGAIRPTQN